MEESYACPWCGASGTSTIKKGFRKTKTMGRRCVRFCRACGRKFTPKNQTLGRQEQSGATEPEARHKIVSDSSEATNLHDKQAE